MGKPVIGCLIPGTITKFAIHLTTSAFKMLFQKARLGIPAILALVILRLVVGWHFFMEGVDKVQKGGFSSTGFLSAAKGPLAPKFQSMIPDYDGTLRLNPGPAKDKGPKDTYEESPLELEYRRFVGEASKLFQFSETQVAAAREILVASRSQLASTYAEWKPKIDEYKKGVPRIANLQTDTMRNNVTSMRKQKDSIESEWRGLVRPVLSEIDKISAQFESQINALATSEQRGKDGKRVAVFSLPGESPVDVKVIDKIIPIFDMCVGILLILGLLTPVAGVAAGIFLASVVLTQFPGSYGSQPTYYQAIEMMACFFLAFSDAGRYAGLDFIPWSFWNRNVPRRRSSSR